MSKREEAESAIYERVAKLAEEADAAELETISKAAMNVAYGPQGADTHYQADNRQATDYHTTQHRGEDRDKPIGFGDEG